VADFNLILPLHNISHILSCFRYFNEALRVINGRSAYNIEVLALSVVQLSSPGWQCRSPGFWPHNCNHDIRLNRAAAANKTFVDTQDFIHKTCTWMLVTISRECDNQACSLETTDKSIMVKSLAEAVPDDVLDIGNYLRQMIDGGNRFRMPYL